MEFLLFFALLRRANDIQNFQDLGGSSQTLFLFFFAWEMSHPNRTLAFANASSPDKSTHWSQHSPHITFHKGFV
jgi:hypothetical protein